MDGFAKTLVLFRNFSALSVSPLTMLLDKKSWYVALLQLTRLPVHIMLNSLDVLLVCQSEQ